MRSGDEEEDEEEQQREDEDEGKEDEDEEKLKSRTSWPKTARDWRRPRPMRWTSRRGWILCGARAEPAVMQR